jgi:integrase/recombinase XerD
MKVQKIKLSSCDVTWIVLDDNHFPIKPITEFVRYLNNVDKSPCTVKSYTYCLKLFWDYLADKQLNWKTINLANLAGFVGWLRQPKESPQVIDLHRKSPSDYKCYFRLFI